MSGVPDSYQVMPLEFEAAGQTGEERAQRLQTVLEAPGFPSSCVMLIDLIRRRADVAVFDFTTQGVAIRYQIDGLWHPMATMDLANGEMMLVVVKHLAGMNYEERQARQNGSFRLLYDGVKYKFRIVSQGVQAGERIGVYVDFKRPPLETVDDLGMRGSMKAELSAMVEADKGLLLTAAMPGEGYTTVWRGMLNACDRFTRDFYVLEEKSRVEPEVINVTGITYDEKAGQNAFSDMRALLLREPQVVAFAEIPSGKLLNAIVELAENESLMTFSRLHGKNAVDALLRLLAMKPDLPKVAEQLSGILSMRVLRKLCPSCRLGFAPDERLLASLGIPPGRIKQLYKAFVYVPGQLDPKGKEIPPCPKCMGTGYFGRIGLFELLKTTNSIRKTIASGKLAELPKVIAESGHISMREEAILLVAQGTTSLDEVQRVLNK